MHNTHRIALVAVCLLGLSGAALQASVSTGDRVALSTRLFQQIDRAAQSYRSRQRMAQDAERSKARLAELQLEAQTLAAERAMLEQSVLRLEDAWRALRGEGIDAADVRRGPQVLRAQQRMVMDLARSRYLAELEPAVMRFVREWSQGRALVSEWQLSASLFTGALQAGTAVHGDLAIAKERLLENRDRSSTVAADILALEESVKRSEEEMFSVQGITRDVHDQVLLLQGQLARIDAQLRSRSERELIEKGLLSARSEHDRAAGPDFLWPARGPISAGFRDVPYRSFFGVPHLGADIAVPHGTPVVSAADGIVFLVREGGEKGYTYVLIGHRGGMATLYGHLSQTLVQAGQRVTAGQQIAVSGGTPGTPGAGPMTSGAHLHFEVIDDGENVDPISVLP